MAVLVVQFAVLIIETCWIHLQISHHFFPMILLAEAICSKNSEKNMGNLYEFLLPKQDGFPTIYLCLILQFSSLKYPV